jgi:hypothetical protein
MPPITSKIHSWFTNISIPDKYGLCLAALLLVWLVYWLGRRYSCWVLRVHRVVSWRRLLQSPVPLILRWFDISSWLQLSVITVLISANIVVVSLSANSFAEVQKRAGSLAVIHLLTLCSGFTFSLPSDICNMDRNTLGWLHRWFGRTCVLHCLIHGSVVVNIARKSAITAASYVVPLIVSVSSIVPDILFPSYLPFVS